MGGGEFDTVYRTGLARQIHPIPESRLHQAGLDQSISVPLYSIRLGHTTPFKTARCKSVNSKYTRQIRNQTSDFCQLFLIFSSTVLINFQSRSNHEPLGRMTNISQGQSNRSVINQICQVVCTVHAHAVMRLQ